MLSLTEARVHSMYGMHVWFKQRCLHLTQKNCLIRTLKFQNQSIQHQNGLKMFLIFYVSSFCIFIEQLIYISFKFNPSAGCKLHLHRPYLTHKEQNLRVLSLKYLSKP